MHRISIKQVLYMDRIELLIEEFDPIPDGIEDLMVFKTALEDKKYFFTSNSR